MAYLNIYLGVIDAGLTTFFALALVNDYQLNLYFVGWLPLGLVILFYLVQLAVRNSSKNLRKEA